MKLGLSRRKADFPGVVSLPHSIHRAWRQCNRSYAFPSRLP